MRVSDKIKFCLQNFMQYFHRHPIASIIAGHSVVVVVMGITLLSSTFGSQLLGAFAQISCARGDQSYMVVRGDTLGAIANRYHTNWQRLASYNRITNPNIIYVYQRLCIPGNTSETSKNKFIPTSGQVNVFPYGQCTWWANQRYHQVHGFYVPWHTNANAWQWTARAYDFRWQVTGRPSLGAIIALQPGVQGAYRFGHVAVVERVLWNGHVIASTMNWGTRYWQVTYVEFSPGPGVSFINV